MPHSVDELLNQFKQHAAVHASIDYGDRSSVRAGNGAADAMIAIAKQMAAMSPPALADFSSLIDVDHETARWTAHLALEQFAPDSDVERRALTIIEREAAGDGVNAMGNRMWLAEWRKRQGRTT